MAYKNDRTKNRRRYKSRYRSAHSYKQKRSSSQTRAAVLVSVLTFVVIASLVIVFTFGDSIYTMLDNTLDNITATDVPTEPSTEIPTNAPTEAPTQAPTDPPVEQSDEFMALLESSSMKLEDIKVDQMMFAQVDEENLTCTITCFEKDETGLYVKPFEPLNGFIGVEGADTMITPYEAKTPIGLFKIEYTFGTRPDPGTEFEYTQFTDADYWITDPNSANYNRWMSTYEGGDWSSSQWLFEYTRSYPHAIVFDYNRDPVDHSQGCAKFIHVSYEPTKNGGIGLSENDILNLLYWIKPSGNPYIKIFI
ncbi:MAG: hypothetical protein IJE16_08810 [Ruminococcus sp.]|nr:hypothetical protein [Ruminococcus sp.]